MPEDESGPLTNSVRTWQVAFDREMEAAEVARLRDNKGRSRVCARRAAGIIATVALEQRGVRSTAVSALDQLELLQKSLGKSHAASPLLEHLLLQVDEQFDLPQGIDLLADARELRRLVLI